MPAIPDDMEQFHRTKRSRSVIYGPPDCTHPQKYQECGFGLAGGGYGPYMYCSQCGRVYNKTQIED